MKTTIDLPDELLHRAKVAAAQRQTTLKELVQTGLDWVLRSGTDVAEREEALAHLRKGLHLGGKPLTREQAHERR
jgi:copper homeostasis protein CutC